MFISLSELIRNYDLKITGVVHIGAHNCEERPIYSACAISDENIIWIEAQPDKCQQIKSRDAKIKIYQAVVTDKDGKDVNFMVTNNGESSSIFELQDHKQLYADVVEVKRVPLKTKTLDSLFKENKEDMSKYNFLNMDIQGAELLALKGAKEYLQHVKYIYAEVSVRPLYKNGVLLPQLDEFLLAQGFVRVDMHIIPDANAGWGDAFYVRSSLSLPLYVIHAPTLTERKANLMRYFNKYNIGGYTFLNRNIAASLDSKKVDTFFKDDALIRLQRARVTSPTLTTFNKPSPAAIAATMEHIEGWREMLRKGQKMALFLEDDALLCDDFARVFQIYYKELPQDIHIAVLHDGCGQHLNITDPEQLWYAMPRHFMRTCCSYIITAEAARKLLSTIIPFFLPIDWEMNYHNTQHNLNIYWAEPNIIKEGSEMPGMFASSTKAQTLEGKLAVKEETVLAVKEEKGLVEKKITRSFRQIIFCNTAHLGDIFLGKEFIRWIMKNIKAKVYIISHHYNDSLLRDLDAVFVKDFYDIGEKSWFIHKGPNLEEDLYVNCWIASNGRHFYNQKIGLGIAPMMTMFAHNLRHFCNVELKEEVKDMIPNIDYSKYPAINNIKAYLSTRGQRSAVLLANNLVLSGQAYNVNLNKVHQRLVDKYPQIDFYFSNKVFDEEVKGPNVVYFDTLVSGCNLIELTYLASKCIYVIGKGSGPFTYCLCRPVLDSSAKLISFTTTHDYDATGNLEKVYIDNKFTCYRDSEDPEVYYTTVDKHLSAISG